MKTMKLVDLAKTIRSKNAGTDRITFDIIFRDPENYELVKKSGVLNRQFVCDLYGIPESRLADFVEFDPGYAIKFTINRCFFFLTLRHQSTNLFRNLITVSTKCVCFPLRLTALGV